MPKKDSFILYADAYDSIRSLTLAQKGELLDAIFLFQRCEDIPKLDPVVGMAFSFIRRSFERDAAKYAKKCEKAKESARMRWHANACERKKRNANDADTDTVPVPDTAPEIYTDNSYEPSGHISKAVKKPARESKRPRRCDPEQWEKYLRYSESFLIGRREELGKIVSVTESNIVGGAIALDNLIRVQGFEKRTVDAAIKWGIADSFWCTEIRSLAGLTRRSKNGDTKFRNLLSAQFREKSNG